MKYLNCQTAVKCLGVFIVALFSTIATFVQGWPANSELTSCLGGSLDNLVQDGGNMPTPGAGTYKVKLDLTKLPYTATVTAVK